MAKGKKVSKTSATKRSVFFIAYLLVKYFLLKIVAFPDLIIQYIVPLLLQLQTQSSNIFKRIFEFLILKRIFHHKRGRPRTKPLLIVFQLRLRHFLNRLIPRKNRVKITLAIFTLTLFFTIYSSFQLAALLPNPKRLVTPDRSVTTEFYDRHGKLLYRLYEGKNRSLINIGELPSYVAQSTIAIEDKNFYHHIGIDPIAIIRAITRNIQEGKTEGASTITQQLIKNTLLTPEKTYIRKSKEAILAFWAERIYAKKDILQMYLNEAPYGGPAWGIEAASQMYFGKSAKDLSLSEASYLAGLPASPTEFSPYGTQPNLGKQRQKEVLRRMSEDRYITLEQAEQAFSEELNILPPINNIKAPHFVMYLRDLLSKKYGPRVVSQGGLKVYTTLDLNLQETVQDIVRKEIDSLAYLDVSNGAAIVTEAKTGQILAMVGSRDYYYAGFGNFNVTIALRQPGSSIKPITYAAAFKQGYIPGNTILDNPITYRDEWGNSYSPINYDGGFHGPVSLRTALGSSYNIPAVKLLNEIGLDNMLQTAKDLGITTFNDRKNYGLSLTLGAGEVKMIDMVSVYGTFANNGLKQEITPILKIVDTDGNIIEEYQNDLKQVIRPEIAYLINNILSDNKARTPAFGPHSLLYFKDKAVAVKTGTTDNKKDNWTFGYTPTYVVGTWVGNNNNRPMHPNLSSGITGAAPIWNKIMTFLIKDHPNIAFKRPLGIIEVEVDGRKDLAIAGITPKGLVKNRDRKAKTIDAFAADSTQAAAIYP